MSGQTPAERMFTVRLRTQSLCVKVLYKEEQGGQRMPTKRNVS